MLKQDSTAFVTAFIDYYGLYAHHKFPNWDELEKSIDPFKKIDILQNGMLSDIETSIQSRFVPYIQLHEFEALLLCNIDIFKNNFENNEFADFDYLIETFVSQTNPELINDGKQTAPSKRLQRILKSYNKVIYGSLLAQEIGLTSMRQKCKHFNNWIISLENLNQ